MSAESAVQWLADNPWISLVVALSGLVGLVATFVFRPRKRLAYAVVSATVIDRIPEALGKIRVEYDGKPVRGVGVTRLAFWNAGNQELDGSDFQTANPLRIVPRANCKILEANVVRASDDVFGFKMHDPNADSARLLTCNYVNPSQGCIIQVVHTLDDDVHVDLVGSVKGVTRLEKRSAIRASPDSMSFKLAKRVLIGRIALGVFCAVYGVLFFLLGIAAGTWKGYLISISVIVLGLYGLWKVLPKVPLKVRRLV